MNAPAPESSLIIGAAHGGGLFAGRFFLEGKPYALIVAPAAAGELKDTKWGPTKNVVGATSYADGLANTQAMAKAGSNLVKWARALRIAGHVDWYIPSRLEMLIALGELGDKGVFDRTWYWTSTQYASTSAYAWYQDFISGGQDHRRKDYELRARAVRRLVIE